MLGELALVKAREDYLSSGEIGLMRIRAMNVCACYSLPDNNWARVSVLVR